MCDPKQNHSNKKTYFIFFLKNVNVNVNVHKKMKIQLYLFLYIKDRICTAISETLRLMMVCSLICLYRYVTSKLLYFAKTFAIR